MEKDLSINKVKGYRVMVNLTQEELAKKLGIALRSYQNKEQGITKFTVDELKAIKNIIAEQGVEIAIDDLV